jgi:hypothetical protein
MPLCIRKTSPKPYCADVPRVLSVGISEQALKCRRNGFTDVCSACCAA